MTPEIAIGAFRLSPAVLAAPMAGATDPPFRDTLLSLGAPWVEGEMISANPDLLGNKSTGQKLFFGGEPRPHIVQILGRNPSWVARAAEKAVRAGADIIDINAGCPVKKICRRGEGAALLLEPSTLSRVIASAAAASGLPVTVKMRAGWNAGEILAVRAAAAAEAAGAAMVTVHGRFRSDFCSGRADHSVAALVKRAVSIPVVTNGDIDSPAAAAAALEESGADGAMIGRALLGSPWLAHRAACVLSGLPDPGEPSPDERAAAAAAHFDRHIAFYGEAAGMRTFRRHACWYLGSAAAARELFSAGSPAEMREKLISALMLAPPRH